jgi:acetylornithine deacetylase/succinyl-diaminopimelate desuccinylase-like protein
MDAQPDREAFFRKKYGVRRFVSDLGGRDLKRAVFNPTCNIGGLMAGYQGHGMKTVIPARASAKLDFRLVPDQDPDEIFAQLRRHLDAEGFDDVQATRLGAMWPYKADADNPFVRLTARTAEEIYHQPFDIDPIGGGSSPVYAFARPLGGIPVVRAGVGYENSQTHAPNEHVRLVDFLNAARHIARILDGFADL